MTRDHEESEKEFAVPNHSEHRNITGPLILIIIGIIFLFNNFNLLPWSIWTQLWRLWPVILILTGLEIFVGRSKAARLVLFLASLILMLGLLTAAGKGLLPYTHWPFPIVFGPNRSLQSRPERLTKTIAVSPQDLDSLVKQTKLVFKVGAMDLTLDDTVMSDYVDLTSTYYRGFGEPVVEREIEGDTLAITVSTKNTEEWSELMMGGVKQNATLGASLPTSLEVDSGASRVEGNLNQVKLNDLMIKCGAGVVTLTLGPESLPINPSVIQVGAGGVTLHLPQNTGVKVSYSVGAGQIKLNEEQAWVGTGTFTTANYGSAKDKVDLAVSAGAGFVKILTDGK